MKNTRSPYLPQKPSLLVVVLLGLIVGTLLIFGFNRAASNPIFCNQAVTVAASAAGDSKPTQTQLDAILHYATSPIVPQQSLAEIGVSFRVLQLRAPCNFLVFGLGHDSLMWDSLNPHGTTLFLEEDPKWVQTVLKDAPNLRAHTVEYRTKLSDADDLFKSYRSEPDCTPSNPFLRGNTRCKLALTGMPDEVYDKEWDLIMIDAPRGYFATLPGRMAPIYSAAVMARKRKGSGVTHVFLHDIDRRVEKLFAEEFLCRKYLVKAVGRLWHFEIPAAANVSAWSDGAPFC